MLHNLLLSVSSDTYLFATSRIHLFNFSASASVSTNLFQTIFLCSSYIGKLITTRLLSFLMCSSNLGTIPSSYIVFHKNIICVDHVVHHNTSFNINSKFLSIFFLLWHDAMVSTSSNINKSGLNFPSGAV